MFQRKRLIVFSDGSDEKKAFDTTHQMKLEFFYIDRKMKNITRRFYILFAKCPCFIHIRQKKIGFKSILEFSFRQRTFENSLNKGITFFNLLVNSKSDLHFNTHRQESV